MNSTSSASGLTTVAPTVSAALRARLRLRLRAQTAGRLALQCLGFERTPRMLTAVGVERRVARPECRRRVLDGEHGKRHKVSQSSPRSAAKERWTSAVTPFTRSALLVV